ncbi:MAG: VWD domain-containing protein [Brumimicrobium sp.]
MKRLLYTLILALVLPTLVSAINEPDVQKSYDKGESEHIKEIFTAWDENEGPWLYESMGAIVMNEQHPERPLNVNNTTYELLQKMDNNRKERIERIAETELENEQNGVRDSEGQYYWVEWLELLRASNCEMSESSSNGDPHMRTYDGEKYDFQTAGDYLLTSSDDENFLIQSQQVRHNENISVNGAAHLNVNGDVVELYAQNHPDEHKDKTMRINGQIVENERSEIILEHGGVIRYQNGRNVVSWPTGEQVHFSVRSFQNSKLLDLFIFVPECRSNYEGLMGNNNGDRNDDLTVKDEEGEVVSSREDVDREYDNLFGEDRKNKNTRERKEADLNYIARNFGNQYMLDEETSRFTNPMVNLSDSARYPTEHLTLAQMEDEEVEKALDKCRAAGVVEEDLFECAFDYGYVGLEPIKHPTYLAQNVIKENNVPQNQEDKANKNNQNDRNTAPQIRIGTGVFRPVITPRTPRTQPRPDRNVRTPRTGGTPRGGR